MKDFSDGRRLELHQPVDLLLLRLIPVVFQQSPSWFTGRWVEAVIEERQIVIGDVLDRGVLPNARTPRRALVGTPEAADHKALPRQRRNISEVLLPPFLEVLGEEMAREVVISWLYLVGPIHMRRVDEL